MHLTLLPFLPIASAVFLGISDDTGCPNTYNPPGPSVSGTIGCTTFADLNTKSAFAQGITDQIQQCAISVYTSTDCSDDSIVASWFYGENGKCISAPDGQSIPAYTVDEC
ncbi:hypothetical protein PRZ48_015116 [Zasmidium cellare]|uniref:Uncharacterized protein n=1 Tax=Zasmidium cellare TaxID=395010 RepID=A0ABR0DY54_ZASCE|nr:hypothetical protein PRZ48_015116 [Zasmidium cellare]